MSKVQNPIIGRAKGQAGGMVFTTLNGQNVMKAKPNSYRDANTMAQRANRSLHILIVLLVSSIKLFARSLFEKQPSDMPAFSKLVHQFHSAVDRSGVEPVFEPRGIVIGSGSVVIDIDNVSYDTGTGIIDVDFTPVTELDADDLALKPELIVIDKSTLKVWILKQDFNAFSAGQASFEHIAGLSAANLRYALKNPTKFKGGADLQKSVK